MSWLRKLAPSGFDFPHRAPTQFWMMSTFALFVGIAVVVVGLYALLFLRNSVRTEARDALYRQAERVALQQERPMTSDEMTRIVRQISRFTGLRITIGTVDSVFIDVEGGEPVQRDMQFGTMDEVIQASTQGHGSTERFDEEGRVVLYSAIRMAGSNVVVRLGQEEPPLYSILRRMLVALLVSMIFALILALLGSWIASQRITDPLRNLTESARRISEGVFEEEIGVESRASEFQDLSNSLNLMAEHFRDDIKQLQRLIRIQNEFLGNVSHEVRNPIFAISGYLEALGSPQLTPAMRERYARKGLANLQRLNTLFSDLVEIARLEYREDLIHPEPFELHEMLREVEETARISAEEKNLSLTVAKKPMVVVGDRNRIRQVLTNLIENAIAYTDSGSITCRYYQTNGKVRIEVVDTGRGIGEEHQERVFDRFYRVDPARSRKSGGSGLGLSIVRQILHAHGEAIHLESTEGKGSRFWFELPYAPELPQEDEEETTAFP